MQPAVLLALLLPSASASGGGGGGGGGDALSAECLSGFANATCSMVHHEIGFHPGERNGMVMSVNCEAANKLPTQTCSVSHECTTCSHYQCVWCSEDERSKIYVEPLGDKFLFLIVSLTAGAFISTLLEWMPRQTFHPPFTVVMFVLGMLMGMLAENNSLGCALSDSVNAWKHQDPHSILYALLPPLLFESAFNVNYHVFTKVMKSSILLATTGVLTSTFLTGCVGMWFFSAQFDRIQYENPACSMFGEGNPLDYAHAHGEFGVAPPKTDGLGNRDELGNCILDDLSGDHRRLSGGSGAAGSADGCYDCSMDGWWASFMFGAIVSATDPVAVVAVLQTLGAQPKLSHMIEGESLLNDGSAVVIFLVFKGLLLHEIQESGTSTTIWKMVALVARLGGGGVVVGAAFSYIVYAWLRISRNMTANIEISVMVLSVYLVFYIAEHVFGASGVLATVVYGLSLAKRKHLAMTVQTEEQNEVVWQEIGYVANSFTFALAGVILWRIVTKSLGDDSHDDRFQRGNQLLLAVGLYFILALIRLFAIFLHYHAMRAATKGGYKVQVKVRNTSFLSQFTIKTINSPRQARDKRRKTVEKKRRFLQEAFFMTYAGLRGAVSLCVALFVDHMDGMPQLVKDVIIFHTCLCVFFTVFVNGITAGGVYKALRLGVQGGVRGEVDAGSVRILVEEMENYVDGMKLHWFHGEHNVRTEGYTLVKDMLKLTLRKDKKGRDMPPINDTGDLTLYKNDVNLKWEKGMMKTARGQWRTDPLRSTTHRSHKNQAGTTEEDLGDEHKYDGLTDAMITEKRQLCYNPDPHPDHPEAAGEEEGAFTAAPDNDKKTHAQREGSLERASSKNKAHSRYQLRLDDHEGVHDIQQDLYSIYLTAIRAHYEEMHEENELTATACDYLCRAIANGSDYLKSVNMGLHSAEHLEEDGLAVIHRAHDSLKEHIHTFGLSGAWSAPPIHKLQIMTECYWAEFEAHEKVATYLHLHLAGALTDVKGKAVHERIRKECEDVCAGSLLELARRSYQQHTLMPVAHTFMVFRAGYLFMIEELNQLKVHGLMSGSCHDEILALLAKRYQDIRAEFSNDGLHGQWIRMREWCFRHCFNKSKYQVEDVDTQIVALKHHEEIKILKSQSQRHLPTAEPTAEPDLVPARVGGEAAGGGDARP